MSGLTDDTSYLFAVFLEALFYGINLVFVGPALLTLRRRAHDHALAWVMYGAVFLQFALITAHVAVNLRCLYYGFVLNRPAMDPSVYFALQSNPLNLARIVLSGTAVLLGDAILIWRCFIVWNMRIAVVILPVCLLLVNGALGGYNTCIISRLDPTQTVNTPLIEKVTTVWFLLAMINNLTLTGLIAYRIWSSLRNLTGTMGPSLHTQNYVRLLLIMVESAALVPIALIIELCIYLSRNEAAWILFSVLPQVAALAPNLIVVLPTLNMSSTGNAAFFQSALHEPESSSRQFPLKTMRSARSGRDLASQGGIQIEVDRFVQDDRSDVAGFSVGTDDLDKISSMGGTDDVDKVAGSIDA